MRINLVQDAWQWKFGDEEFFTVRYVRYSLDVSHLPFASIATHWCKILPIKVNMLVWRAMLNHLPTRSSLDHRGIDIESLLCPCCNNNVEDSNHVFLLVILLWSYGTESRCGWIFISQSSLIWLTCFNGSMSTVEGLSNGGS
ncbi:reverse transcriptase zinc-binding domain-containing protein [Artemisia annua]|uniref:Reverse transcriptase zinc-binding domain-containing protein n=1 Tax=Artemisia annua TaxID=35608 RepID=A0A2U1ME95_ARTAN|nr:reverse transcriptase zinc-binding domain-containing protein [Artemisia annua]